MEAKYPSDATMSPDGTEVWVVGELGNNGVVVLETAGNTVTHRIHMGGTTYGTPVDVVFGLDGFTAYVSMRGWRKLVVLDVPSHSATGTLISIASGGTGIGKMAVHPVNGQLYVLDWIQPQLHIVDPVTHNVVSHAIGTGLSNLVFDATGETLYIADGGAGQVHVINVADLTVVTSIAVGDTPMGIDLTPDGSLLFVANLYGRGVSVIDTLTNSVTTTIDFGTACFPRDLDISADGSTVYVTTGIIFGDDGLWVIDVATLTTIDRYGVLDDSSSRTVAVAPEIVTHLVFADGFESGDTAPWSSTSP